ncbi:MAG: hypothetical protein D6719_02605 [Candidatus Dadabacteria bacterium]|nr:MAG: hypothetical protein D6719_02605 [Candidatus Dadabacteria bacterium]
MKLKLFYVTMAMISAGAISGCAASSASQTAPASQREVYVERTSGELPVPGVVQYIWEEPMVDVVTVPPGLDPEGHYYRPAHQEVVEIRQGRWRYYKQPGK